MSRFLSVEAHRDLFAEGTPILMYHRLGPRHPRSRLESLCLPVRDFAAQLAAFSAAGYTTASLDDLLRPGGPGPRRFVITFDDGFEDTAVHGLDLLRTHGFQAIQFLVSGQLGGSNVWDRPLGEPPASLMSVPRVREWLAAGHAIGAHTVTHPHLAEIPAAQARDEIRASRLRLEDVFGIPVRHFAYPYGQWNPALAGMTNDAGFASALTTDWGVARPVSSPLTLPRLPVLATLPVFTRLRRRLQRRLFPRSWPAPF